MINTGNEMTIATVQNLKPDVIIGALVSFTDFQRKPRFGSKIAEMFLALQEKADFLIILSFRFCRL